MKMVQIAASACIAAFACSSSPAQTVTLPGYFVETVATGLDLPTNFAFIGDNDILVVEQWTGKVKRFLDRAYMGEVLDLTVVTSEFESGLLGIVVHPDFEENGYVYLYYSHAEEKAGEWTDNRVERFTWTGSKLTFDSMIIQFPRDESQANVPAHNAGIMRFGPDGKLYVITGDLYRGPFGNPRIEQNTDETAVAGVGGIYRLNPDGAIPSDNPFFSHPDPRIRALFAYGIRNSFGMEFDPLTGRLWFTENGPNVYDEVNIVDAGMNSGWLKIMGPDAREAAYGRNGGRSWDATDLVYLPGAFYRDPVFSWLTPIGVTAIQFLNSRKFGPNERNHVMVGEFNQPRGIYLFEVNAARDGFVLSGGTKDRVADNNKERQQNVVGSNWQIITDMRIGPDGYLYISTLYQSSIFRIRPEMDPFVPESFVVARGLALSGDLQSLADSDDDRLVIRPWFVLTTIEAPVQVIVEATSPVETTTELKFTLEASASIPNIMQSIELFNFTSGMYEEVDARMAAISDSVVELTFLADPSRFIQPGTKTMRARLKWKEAGPILLYPWRARVDQVIWTVRVQ
ncbi:MAG: PQQ-dependent sugar dehydrogenase [Armatimonadetes bacterium]|nr:PQQ-dependent sugar dehydrogenase [Armatimonadota bacterium]